METEEEFGRCIWGTEWPIKIQFDVPLTITIEDKIKRMYDNYKCPHVTKENTLPIVIVGTNEGGYNSTGICYHCVQDYLKAKGK